VPPDTSLPIFEGPAGAFALFGIFAAVVAHMLKDVSEAELEKMMQATEDETQKKIIQLVLDERRRVA